MYTANIAKYRPERTDIKCYTEDKLGNPHYSSRLYKVLSHVYDPVEWSVYVDADIFLPEGLAERLIEEVKESGKLVGAFKHPWRDCIFTEAEEILRLKKDTEGAVREHIEKYKDFPRYAGLAACGVLVRKKTDAVRRANRYWWEMVCSGSKRDQLSFPIAFFGGIHYFEGNIYDYKRKV